MLPESHRHRVVSSE